MSVGLAGLAGLAALGLLLVACGDGAATDDPSPTDDPAPIASAQGHWGVTAAGSPNLHLTEDGSFTGTDGCNRMFGSWREDASADDPSATTVHFTDVGMTKMMCPDVDTWLERIDTGRLVGDDLHILAADGTEIGSLARAH